MDFSQLDNPVTMASFQRDYVAATAAALNLPATSVSILPGSPRRGSVIVDTRAVAANESAAATLDNAVRALQADPVTAYGSNFTSAYNVKDIQVAVLAYPAPPSPAPPPPPLRSPRPPSPYPPTPSPPQGGCQSSRLNYTCSITSGGVTIHYTVNETRPDNACTRQPGMLALDPQNGVLHMAIEAYTTGFVGLGFASSNKMTNSDVVYGYVSSSTNPPSMARSWYIPADDYTYLTATNYLQDSWATNMGVVQVQAGGRPTTILCFSRNWTSIKSRIAPSISTTSDTNMIWAAAGDGVVGFGNPHDGRGVVTINFATGNSQEAAVFSLKDKVNVHGALMSVAWVLLLPVGTLFARHRPLLGETKLFGLHIWFQIHRAMQLSGMVLFIVGFAWAVHYFPNPTVMGDTGQAHRVLGIIVMGLAGTQVVAAFIRPAPDAPNRKYWNLLHHNLGRLTMLVAWTTIYLGIYIFHKAPSLNADLESWVVPVAVVMGTLVVLDLIVLPLMAKRLVAPSDGDVKSLELAGNDDSSHASIHVAAPATHGAKTSA